MTDWLSVHKKSVSIGVTHGHVIFSNTFQLFGLRWWTGSMNGRETSKPVWFKTETHLLWALNTHFPQNIPVNFISMAALLCLVNRKWDWRCFFLLLKTPDGQQMDADLLMKRPVCLPDCFSSVPTSLVSHVTDVQVWLGNLAKGHLIQTIMDT